MDELQRAVVLLDEPVAQISPYLHGQFAEHLGELIYPGLYVDPAGDIPNTDGLRHDVVEALKPLDLSVLRWPGGCFADNYHWRDGIGPREQRPKRLNVWWGMAPEPNQFGTHEFMNFCHAIGAEPYFAGNVGSGSPAELRDWVEYCNYAGDSTLADERRANGANDPFRISFWGVGNENWGCGGNMRPEAYADLFARYRTFLFNHSGTQVSAIACGPNGSDWAWTRRFFEQIQFTTDHCRLKMLQGFAAHYYCGTAGNATQYTESQWLELLTKAHAVEGIITGHRAIMDAYDPERNIKLILDEWGTWHPVEAGKPGSGLYQQNTIRDACVAALTLDVFNNHADKLYMANIAQLINVLQSLLLVEGDRCIKTPTYHVFDLYRSHKSAKAVRFLSEAEVVSYGEAAAEHVRKCYADKQATGLQALHGSASVRDGVLCVTAVNTHPTEQIEFELELRGGKLNEAELVRLVADEIHQHNTFEQPDIVHLSQPQMVQRQGEHLRVQMPAGSIIRISGKLS
jgi:alpha-N-arabinofuranosidase